MNRILTLTKKELASYFNSPLGYVVISVFLLVSSWLFIQTFFLAGQVFMRNYFGILPMLFMFILPAITMSLWSEEKRSGTVEVLMTFPVTTAEAVAAKFFSSFIFLAVMLLLTAAIPAMLINLGNPDRGIIIAGYVGTLFLGASYIAIGLWVSSITKNQIVSFIATAAIIFIFYIVGDSFVIGSLPASLAGIGKFLSLGAHFDSILRGVISLRDIVYYSSIIVFFLFLNIRVVGLKNWK